MHPRKAIREAVVEILKGKTIADQRVFANRRKPVWEGELPAILVYAEKETAEEQTQAPRQLERTIKLEVVIGLEPSDELDDRFDEITREVELLLSQDETLNGTATDSILTETQLTEGVSGQREIGFATLFFDVTYTDGMWAEDPVNDFNKLNSTIQNGQTDAKIDGHIDFNE